MTVLERAVAAAASAVEANPEGSALAWREAARMATGGVAVSPRRPSEWAVMSVGIPHRGATSNKPSRSGSQQPEQATRAAAGSTTSTPPTPPRGGAVEGSAAAP